ncbi:tRNA (adenine(22)-N(1))-methyltransferase [Salinibius halmophilus]|uniref:tRNA (adenine(22)-N(1))-methyltransferase n=1 Tax=Salinibius halmophilus TaxID=1853216 RepID=UPI000E6676F2|nr:tRNA (adenine(22)-N(1))-methyltransferase TrmK [Salinibius halmophilus]
MSAFAKLSRRLQTIYDMVPENLDHIWDTCCDHGYLGYKLLQHNKASIHFVDISPTIMQALEQNLIEHAHGKPWHCHTLNLNVLPLAQFNGKQMVIIAGVGGELIAESIEYLSRFAIELIVCPVHHSYLVRQRLNDFNFGLINEALVQENKRFYEVIHVSNQSGDANPISPTGDKIWQHPDAAAYLGKLLNHYRHKPEQTVTYQDYQLVQLPQHHK